MGQKCFSLFLTKPSLARTNSGLRNDLSGTSLMEQWIRLRTRNAEGLGSIPGQGTRSHMPQLRVRVPQLKIPHATTKDPVCRN